MGPGAVTGLPDWVCPEHQLELDLGADRLVCAAGHAFPVVGGIPRFVPDTSYADAFGLQWRRYTKTQLDSYSKTPISRDRLRRCFGPELFARLKDMRILECGCGAGRFTEVLLAEGAQVVSVDLSNAVDANAANAPVSGRHRIAQADIGALPLAPGQFDTVLCLGVIQHTPSPEQTIARLAAHVRPGGYLIIDHYTHNLSWYTKSAPLVRRLLRRLPAETGLRWTEAMVDTLLPLHARVRNVPVARALLTRISPVLCYYHAYPDLDIALQREWALVDTHDSLTDWYKHFRTTRQIRRTLEQLGFVDIWCEKGGNGVEARAMRPV